MGFHGDLMGFEDILMGFHKMLMIFPADLMGLDEMLMGFNGMLMGLNGDLKRFWLASIPLSIRKYVNFFLGGSTGDLKRFEATTFLKVSSPPVLVPSEVRTNLSVGIVKDRIRLNLSSSPWEKTTGYPQLGMYLGVI